MNDSTATHTYDKRLEDGQLSASAMLVLMRDNYREILLVTFLIASLAVAYAFLATPMYQGDAVVRVDPIEPNPLGLAMHGQDAQSQAVPTPSPAAEMAVMQSRSVIEPVIEKFRFDVTVTPKQIPLLGAIATKLSTPGTPAAPWLGLGSFAWGGEDVAIGTFDVPHDLEEKKFTLTAGVNGLYRLSGPGGEPLIKGEVGKPAIANGVTVNIQKLVARPGTEFTLLRYNLYDAATRFTDLMKISDMAKDTGVLEVTFLADNPFRAANVTNALVEQYLATAVAAKQRQDTQTLAFINRELPRLKSEVKRTAQALTDYRTTAKTLQPTSESQSYLQGSIELQKQYAALQLQRTQMLDKFQPDTRWVKNIDQQLGDLSRAMSLLNGRFADMPVSERTSLDLERDAKVAEDVYLGMVQKSEQLSVRRASSTGGVHIVDYAVTPLHQVKPNQLLVIAGGIVVGILLGCLSVFLRRHVMNGVTDPLFVERQLRVPLIGSVYFSQHQRKHIESDSSNLALPHAMGKGTHGIALPNRLKRRGANLSRDVGSNVLSSKYPQDPAVEAIRQVCSTLLYELNSVPSKVVCVTGPTPGAGKSFIAANLATVLAEVGQRVLLIDGDMRRGRLASQFGLSSAQGLHEVLVGEQHPRSVIRTAIVDGLSLMACGARGVNPATLLMKRSFGELLTDLKQTYDVIVIDTPPTLAVSDASIVAGQADATMLVLRSGLQSEKEILETVKKLERANARILGAVFNAIPARRSDTTYGYIVSDLMQPTVQPS
ncbi:polysaccharide biosynthesis tyrosine autokinase [Caballeronia grimmiae]|uniref:polysaccharide biosynthesis tyrosine autokinase n=1 Tax=Caballeronia grimmiae TaxID=1071679 RepID=UPI0038B9C14E